MSADNYLYVDAELRVFHCCASAELEPIDQDFIGQGTDFPGALRIAEDFGYTEYGVQFADSHLRQESEVGS